ncbi:uncharacterized protein C8Q71DRAFT_56386 [Rhodofomes roseus]|uniref:Uncharacterized protein n=1 Tax=Rhodofomes roseus TaxID=34475 RepID=A0ABQ8KGD7_9APHY|nr:uncharacterized protein C8Q71DRAFT_56386 [Rhodofomes roseus]KAH9836735.1 hypothetical protein C8Q71DRAFT_56386 [Rhodofomes roseus]
MLALVGSVGYKGRRASSGAREHRQFLRGSYQPSRLLITDGMVTLDATDFAAGGVAFGAGAAIGSGLVHDIIGFVSVGCATYQAYWLHVYGQPANCGLAGNLFALLRYYAWDASNVLRRRGLSRRVLASERTSVLSRRRTR